MVHVAYFTDPLCPWSWAAEPEVRRILVEFSEQVAFTYVMAGMSRDIDPDQKLASTLDAMAETGMPADPRLWLDRPPRTSYPACTAVKAASEQGLDAHFLRRLRERAFLHREPVDGAEAFLAAGRTVAGLDLDRFEADLRSEAVAGLFDTDRERSLAACGDQDRRPSLPAFSVAGGDPIGKAQLRAAVLAAGAEPAPLPGVEEALGRFDLLTTAEVAMVCDLPPLRVRVELWRLAGASRARPQELPFGEVWQAA